MSDWNTAVLPAERQVSHTSDASLSAMSLSALVQPTRLQQVIREQQQRFPLLNYEHDLVAVCDFNGFLAYLNPIGRELMGVSADEDLSLFQVRCFTPLTQDLWDEIFTRLLADGLWSGDHILQYRAAPVPVKLLVTAHMPEGASNSEIDCFTIVARVDPRFAELATKAAEIQDCHHLRFMVSNINDVLCQLDRRGKLTYISPRLQALLGHDPNSLIGESPLEFTHPDDRDALAQHIRNVLSGGSADAVELRLPHVDGHYVWLAASTSVIYDENGEVLGFHASLRDISLQKVAEESLQAKTRLLERALKNLQQARTHMVQSEKMSSLGQLVAGMAHEINNPVNFIHGNLKYTGRYIDELIGLIRQYRAAYPEPTTDIQAMIAEIDLDYLLEDLPKMLSSMTIGSDRIREIVLSLRNFSRLDESALKDVDIHEGINSTLLILQNRLKGKDARPAVNVVREFGELPPINCFAGQMNQVFMNLLVNSLDALDDAHAAGLLDQPELRILTQVVGDMVQLRFSDNGPGMSADIKDRMFDPFYTTKPVGKGTGMGLAISYQIVSDRHHGILRCESAVGEGTTFEIQLPITRPSHA